MVKVKGNINPNLLVALLGAIVVLVLLIVFRKRIGRILGIGGSRSDVSAGYFDALADGIEAMQTAGEQASYLPENYASMAESIYRALRFSAVSDNKAEAVRILKQMQTDLDVMLLDQAFGQRQEAWFGINHGGLQSLSQMVTGNLSSRRLAEINEDYQEKGMQYRF